MFQYTEDGRKLQGIRGLEYKGGRGEGGVGGEGGEGGGEREEGGKAAKSLIKVSVQVIIKVYIFP